MNIDLDAVRSDAKEFIDDAIRTNALGYDNMRQGASACRAFLALTDPTPLTVERLAECGGQDYGDGTIYFAPIPLKVIYCQDGTLTFYYPWPEELPLPPRTVGELRQLLLRMEETR